MNTPHTEWPSSALSFMAIEHPTESDLLGFFEACTPCRERDEAITRRNISFRLTGRTTGRLHIEPADPQPEPPVYLWRPGMTREICA